MKKILKISFACLLVFACFSCEEQEEVIYDGDAQNNRTFLSLPSSIFSFPVNVDSSGILEITVNSSTRSSVDRTFPLVLNTDPEATTADPGTYNLPSSFTIPANSYQGTIFVEGMDNGLLDSSPKTISFSVSGLDANTDMDSPDVTVTIFEVCPVDPSFFQGEYMVSNIAGNSVLGCPVFPNGMYTLAVGAGGELERTFTADYVFECGFGAFPRPITFTLVCNETIVSVTDTGLTCDTAVPEVGLSYGQGAAAPGSYDANDDSSFTIQYTENLESDCGGGPQVVSYEFIKQ